MADPEVEALSSARPFSRETRRATKAELPLATAAEITDIWSVSSAAPFGASASLAFCLSSRNQFSAAASEVAAFRASSSTWASLALAALTFLLWLCEHLDSEAGPFGAEAEGGLGGS